MIKGLNKKWHITRDPMICRAKISCENFFIPSTDGCVENFLEIIDGDVTKLRYCGFSNSLEYEARGDTVLNIKTVLKGL